MVYYYFVARAHCTSSKSEEREPALKLSPAGPSSNKTYLHTKRALAWVCALLLLVSTLPLYVISLYNHPYYDDYKFSAEVHAIWQKQHSLPQVLDTALRSAQNVRNTWQGTYTGTLLSNFQPGVFSENLYFLTTFFLLTAFLLCFAFFLKVVFMDWLGLSLHESVILISLTLILLVQFMPDVDEAFFWFNGGIGNTFIYSLIALSLGLCGKFMHCKGRVRQTALTLSLLLLMILLGGGSYGGGVFGLLIYALLALRGFVQKNPKRWLFLTFFGVFLFCFLYSMSAPGNTVRAGVIGYQASPVKAILQAFYYGIAVAGSYIRLPLIAVTALLVPFFVKASKRSVYRFAHPWRILLGGVCLYCAQFAPPLYSGVFIGGGRIVDTYYQSFVVLWLLYTFYLTGFTVRKLEKNPYFSRHVTALTHPSPRTFRTLLLCLSVLMFIGCMGYQRPQSSLYGLQNMASGSAALSLLRGEAAQYDREMKQREALLNDTSQSDVTLAPLSVVPEIFMKDLLTHDAPHDVKPVLCKYYSKNSITLSPEGEP